MTAGIEGWIELATGELDDRELRGELRDSVATIQNIVTGDLMIEFGWGSQLPIEQLWSQRHVTACEVASIVASAEDTGVLRFGSADVTVRSQDNKFEIKFTHHSSVHVRTSSKALAKAFATRWLTRKFDVFLRLGDAKWQPMSLSSVDWAE